MRKYFAVAFRALRESTKTIHFSVELTPGRSRSEVSRQGMANFRESLTPQDGWDNWTVVVKGIPEALVQRAVRDAECFDQHGTLRLYATGFYLANPSREKGGVVAGYVMAGNDYLARDKVRAFIEKNYPSADGWEVLASDIAEFTDLPIDRRRSESMWVPRGVTSH